MTLPLSTDYSPMEAKLVDTIPTGDQWLYEPKWDGFRCLAFRDGDSVELMSKAGKPLTRYFPDVADALRAIAARKFVLDGEIVIVHGEALSFDDLLMRIHPAASRVKKLAAETPGTLIVFDLLVDARGKALVAEPFAERREALERFFAEEAHPARVRLSPATRDLEVVEKWMESVGSGLDGIVAKRADLAYQSGNRLGMQKMKQIRTADCVVGGFRYASKGKVVGSLLLGLYDDAGLLQHVGFTSNIPSRDKAEVTTTLEKLVEPPGFTGRAPGGPSRWSTERTGQWEPLATKLVVEVHYDYFDGDRFRHGTSFVRWRPDKAPKQCTLAQVAQESRSAAMLMK
ncbi:MAG TPA: ATP-dependent DNA ligase [Gemmatimonadaceae bacterium]|nr:ATP-dependent DNA ligase [Gemmatimonadaceae bacterium]